MNRNNKVILGDTIVANHYSARLPIGRLEISISRIHPDPYTVPAVDPVDRVVFTAMFGDADGSTEGVTFSGEGYCNTFIISDILPEEHRVSIDHPIPVYWHMNERGECFASLIEPL
jgi:hypothetical protein